VALLWRFMMDLLSDEQLWKILESNDDTPFVVDPEEYALLEKLEKSARNVEKSNELRTPWNPENINSEHLVPFSHKKLVENERLQGQRVAEESQVSESFESVDDDLLACALDSVEQQYLRSSKETNNTHSRHTESILPTSAEVQSECNESLNCCKETCDIYSKAAIAEKPVLSCQVDDGKKQQNIENYVPSCFASSSYPSSTNSPVELVSPQIRGVQRTLEGVTDYLWFPSKSSKRLSKHVPLDMNAARSWIFPTNIPEREYQFNIVRSALACNTLVCLPTGLGKTFIAAVVMYNFLRWYPEGKVVFMAPTKPLVRQQIAACYRVVGIPIEATAEMTGAMKAETRKLMWKSKNAFFVTPQIMKNDIDNGICPASKVVCVVFDEAHKATGKYVYCSLVDDLNKATDSTYRILALSATPGNTVSVIQHVIDNLQIAKVEFRSEDDPDTKPYTFHRQIESVVVPLGAELQEAKKLAMDLLSPFLNNLYNNRAFYERSADRVTIMKLLTARETWKRNFAPQTKEDYSKRSFVLSQFSLAVSLCYGINLLYSHGLAPFDSFLESFESESKQRTSGLKKIIASREKFKQLRQMTSDLMKRGVTHPKALKCVEVLKNHFSETAASNVNYSSRAIVFTQYRESVIELKTILAQHEPLIHAMCFVGQAPSAASHKSQKSSGMSQKEQIEVLREFRKGTFNVLVSTCIGEEGLDIADVDLIVSYDVISSPIRMLQRMGRTGRARAGQIIVLLTEGCEETRLDQMNRRASSIAKSLHDKLNCFSLYEESPRMIPTDGITVSCERKELNIEDIKFSGENSIFPLHCKKSSCRDVEQKKDSVAFVQSAVESMFLESYGLDTRELPPSRLGTKNGVMEFFSKNISSCVSNSNRPYISKMGKLRAQTIALMEHIASGVIQCENFSGIFSEFETNLKLEQSLQSSSSISVSSNDWPEPAFPGLTSTDVESNLNWNSSYDVALDSHEIRLDSGSFGEMGSSNTEADSYLEKICSPPDEKLQDHFAPESFVRENSSPPRKEEEPIEQIKENSQGMVPVKSPGNENNVLDVIHEDDCISEELTPIWRVKKRLKQEKQHSPSPLPNGRKRIKAPKKLRFIQSQASVSSNDLDEEAICEEEEELGSLADFLVDDSESQSESVDENNSSETGDRKNRNMHSIYLRSLLSPENHKLGFASPPRFGKSANKGAMKMGLSKK